MVEDRIAALEERAARLESRVRTLEGTPRRSEVSYPPPARPLVLPEPFPRVPARPRLTAPPKRDLEDVVGGSVLAWLGGVALLAGLAFLLTIAVSRGWIGEGARTALAGVVSLGLLGAGVWLREHRGKTEASLAAAAVGIAGFFGTLVVAGPVYHLIPVPLALIGAFATGAVATTLALRWRAQMMGWLGLLGALSAPLALGAYGGGGIAFLAIAYAATVAVLVWQRWSVLAWSAFVTTTVQWLLWVGLRASDGETAITLVVFGALTAALAIGLEAMRRGAHPVAIGPAARLRPHAGALMLLVSNAALIAWVGWEVLDGERWLTAVALTHVALGLVAARRPRISREFALIVLGTGIVLGNIAFATIATGLPLVIGWALSTLPFAAMLGNPKLFEAIFGRSVQEQPDRVFLLVGLLGQVTLTALEGLLFDAPLTSLPGPLTSSEALIAAAVLALVGAACAALAGPQLRIAFTALALASLGHFTGLALEGAALTATLAGEALLLAGIARRRAGDPIAAWAAAGFAGAGLLHALAVVAQPDALLNGLETPLAAAAALIAVAVAFAAAARTLPGDARRALAAAAALTVLFLASVEIVTAAGPERTGQTLVSVLWAVAGVGALVRGLLTDDGPLRRAALVLLAIAAGKVFLYDLASLDSLSRVGSLMGFGLLLLVGSFSWQRVRPRGAEVA